MTYWIQGRQLFEVLRISDEGILVGRYHGGPCLITWEKAKATHEANPEDGLL